MCLGGTYPSAVLAFEVSQCVVVSAAKPMVCVTTPPWFPFGCFVPPAGCFLFGTQGKPFILGVPC